MAIKHGSQYAYKRQGCRCPECQEANAEANRQWRANRKQRGDAYVRKDRTPALRRPCAGCGTETHAKGPRPLCKPCSMTLRRSVCIRPARRLALYERDNWTCGFCHEAVDPAEPNNSPWQATLDHIVPRSMGGTDAEDNLRLLHRYCNTVRSNSDALTLADV